MDKDLYQVRNYEIPEGLKSLFGEPKVIALEIIDQIITEKFGFHLFES